MNRIAPYALAAAAVVLQGHVCLADAFASMQGKPAPLLPAPNVFLGTSSSGSGDGVTISVPSTIYNASYHAPGPTRAIIGNQSGTYSGTSAAVTFNGMVAMTTSSAAGDARTIAWD